VYEVWHELELDDAEERLHAVAPKVPPAPPSVQETVPVGGVGDEDESATTAVKVIEVPAVADDGFGVTLVVVGCGGWLTVRDDVPELAECAGSPP